MELLERAAHLEQLGELLREAAAGRGGLVFLGGEAGVGKTALVQQLSATARPVARVLIGACDPLSTPRPLSPLIDVAAALGGRLERLLREAAGRGEVFPAFLDELGGATKPALVVFEDVHWADEATLDLLRYLGRRLGARRALLIATYRDDEVGPRHPLRVVLGDLATAAAVRRLGLSPLSADAVRALTVGSDLDPVALHHQTGGNPFFVTEVLAVGDAGGRAIPATVRDAVLARAARLSPSGRAALDAAAVIGSLIEPWLLAAVAGPGEAAEAADECVGAGMLRPQGDRFAFRHELARETVLEALSPPRRATLHGRALAVLRSTGGDPPDLTRLAHHAEAAGDRQAVLEYAPSAARRAASLGAHREAAAQYARALRFAGGLEPADRAALREAYAAECYITDQIAESLTARQAALEIRRAAGDRLKEGENLTRLARVLVVAGRNPEAEAASHAALEVLAALPPGRELAQAYHVAAHLRMLDRDSAEAVALGSEAIALAERLGAADTLAAALNTVGSALLVAGDERGREPLERSLRVALQAGLDDYVGLAYGNLGSALGEQYHLALADRYLAEGIAYCAERDLDRHRLYMLAWQALCRLYQGRWGEAADAVTAVLKRPGAAAISRIMALIALGRVRARRGDPEVADALDEALALAAPTGTLQRLAPVRAARAEAAWLAGDRQRAREEARAAFDLAVRHRHAWFTGELAYWLWLAEDFDPQALPPWAAEPFALQIRGDPACAAGRWEALGCPYEAARALTQCDDEPALRRALETFERLGARPAATALARRLRERGVQGIPRGPRPATRANPANLTTREAEIARLLAEGLRDAEIAERLYLSPKTVGHHVSAVLAKLGVRGRAEVAREAARLGLTARAQSREATTPK